jgi:hypothetical protein
MTNEDKPKHDISRGVNALRKAQSKPRSAMKITDFTHLPLGHAVARGKIEICPYCGKNGVKTKTDDIDFYTHEERIGLNSQGNVEIGWTTCPTDEQVRELQKANAVSSKKKENPKSAEPK